MRNQYRRYTTIYKDICVLVSWIQRRCNICQRFLKNHEYTYCSKCRAKYFPNGRFHRKMLKTSKEWITAGDTINLINFDTFIRSDAISLDHNKKE